MFKYILFLFLTYPALFAEVIPIMAVAKQNGAIIEVKAILGSPMIGEEESKREDVFGNTEPIDYITHIKVLDGKNTVFDLSTTPYYAASSTIKFKYHKLDNSNTLDFFITDHKNKTSQLNKKIKNITPGKALVEFNEHKILPIKYNPKIWKAKTVDKVISLLYKPTKKVQDINLFTVKMLPQDLFSTGDKDTNYIQFGRRTFIYIKSNIKLQSIAILSDTNTYSLAALMTIPFNSIIDYQLAIDSGARCCQGDATVTVVAKGIDGTIYRDNSLPLRVSCSTLDGSCYY